MRFALVKNKRLEASPGLVGCCPGCAQQVIAKCGMQKIWHWAHHGKTNCDPWWEPETSWHRTWKDQFPLEWQEVILRDDSGEKHIADVRTENDLVIEFQHSHLPVQEIAARESFYRNMVWVVDGKRLRRDRARFLGGQRFFSTTSMKGLFVTGSPEKCFPFAWLNCTMPVFFDFGGIVTQNEMSRTNYDDVLWCLLPLRIGGWAVVKAASRGAFLESARSQDQIISSRAIADLIAARLRMTARLRKLQALQMAINQTQEG
jgi:hypothetical protein